MSCQLAVLAQIYDVKLTKKYLFPDVESPDTGQELDGWDNGDWGWKDEDEPEATPQTESMSWLQECKVSLSPSGELMVLSNNDRLVLLAQKYVAQEDNDETKYSLVYEGCVKQEENEKITCVLCVPLASQKRSTHGGQDWTCVFVGFSSGYVRMYTENGTLLLSQLFSMEPVVNIKCRTYEPPRHAADSEKGEELNILYKKSLVSIDGFSLFQSLRACRNQVARAAASGADFMQPPPLAYKKWALNEHEFVADQASAGTVSPNPFDQMVTASMIGGFNATIRSTPPASHLYLSTGKLPYTNFYYIIEGSTQPMLADVAHAVASKLKSALFNQISAASGWFGMGGGKSASADASGKDRKRPRIEPATTVTARHGMHDKRREGEALALSPDSRLAAVTDSFGRVILFDVSRGIAVRIWKGYRDAEVAWVEVREDEPHEKHHRRAAVLRRALFLVIYAPRRGILEVWTAQQGPRVAAFSVSKWCRLLAPSHGLMGLNNVTYKDVRVPLHHLYLIDPEGTVKSLDIPFHLALSDKNSKRARDQHLLKKLKILLKEQDSEAGNLRKSVIDLLTDMKISSIRQQGLERVLLTKYLSVDFIETVIRTILTQLQSQSAVEQPMSEGDDTTTAATPSLDYESKLLLNFCRAQEHLINTYSALFALNSAVQEKNDASDAETLEEKLTKMLSIDSTEIHAIHSELQSYDDKLPEKSSVSFEADYVMTIVEFLGCFECHVHKDDKASDTGAVTSVKIFSQISEAKRMKLANFLFKSVLELGTSSDYNLLLRNSHVVPEDLMSLLMKLWLSVDTRNLSHVSQLHSLIKSITLLKDSREVVNDDQRVSMWWQTIREQLSGATNIKAALLAALATRSVAVRLNKATMVSQDHATNVALQTEDLVTPAMDDDARQGVADWESLTYDRTQWTLLVRQLQDLLVLQCLLKMRPAEMGLVSSAPWQSDPVIVTVKSIIDGGRGKLPELIAKWISAHGITPGVLTLHADTSGGDAGGKPTGESSSEESVKPDEEVVENPIVCQLQAIQVRLPFSLDADILMANCAWEYMVIWNKDPEIMLALELALSFMKCIQNASLQYGISVMTWQMFVIKKFSATALLVEKVGKAPKDRLCRKEVGLSEVSLEKFLKQTVDLLEVISQSAAETGDVPVLNVEDLWHHVQGPTSLAELAVEQKPCNVPLVMHHYTLCVLMYAVLAFSLKSVKPLSLFDTKGRNAFFKPLQSSVSLPTATSIDDSLILARKQVLYKLLTHAVKSLADSETIITTGGSQRLPAHAHTYTTWTQMIPKLSKLLSVDSDDLNRHLCCELYSHAWDTLGQEVLRTVNNREDIGSQLLVIAGKRLHQFVFNRDNAEETVEIMTQCSPRLSTWLKSLDPSQLHVIDPPLQDTATLVGHTVNSLPEGHDEYNMAIELVELVQGLL